MRLKSAIIGAMIVLSTSSAVLANDCSPDVRNALEQNRRTYVEGMSGLATNNFSMRPGTFSKMACLEKFMKGDMDIFFRPPDLNSLLEQALSFACEKIESAVGGGGGGDLDAIALFSDISKGKSFGSGYSSSSRVSAPSLQELFAR